MKKILLFAAASFVVVFLSACTVPVRTSDVLVTSEKYNLQRFNALEKKPLIDRIESESLSLEALVFNQKNYNDTIIIAHGSSGNITTPFWFQLAETVAEVGPRVVLFDYSGYGKSKGAPSIDQLTIDLEAVVKKYDCACRNQKLYLYGVSIGTVPVVELAARSSAIDGIILEAPIGSAQKMAEIRKKRILFGNLINVDIDSSVDFNSFDHAPNIKQPVLLLHGAKDDSVPIELGRELFARIGSKNKKFVSFKNGWHAGLYKINKKKFIGELTEFLN